MANLHDVFKEYNKIIRLSDEKRQELINVRDALRNRIESRYGEVERSENLYHELEFQSQGSFVTDTIIKPVRDDYDLDDGIYFIGSLSQEERPSPATFHKMIIAAIGEGYDHVAEVVDRNTCVRVIFKSGFHVDLPIYYADNLENPDLADKGVGWLLSNPVEFIAWFEEKTASSFKKAYLYESALYDEYRRWITDVRKADVQLRRIVRYMKGWGDLRREEMPCGLIMCILAANYYYPHDRDDISLKETLVSIYDALKRDFRCDRPTTPAGENLLASYKNKEAFLRYMEQFIENAKNALQESDSQKACKYWQKSLGDRFPSQNLQQTVQVNTTSTSALAAGAASSRPWGGEL